MACLITIRIFLEFGFAISKGKHLFSVCPVIGSGNKSVCRIGGSRVYRGRTNLLLK